ATLVKNHAHWKAFETIFEVYFSLRGSEFNIEGDGDDEIEGMVRRMLGGDEDQQGKGGGLEGLTPEQLAEMLYRALMNADEAMMKAIARQAVIRFSGMEPGRPVGGTYYLYRTLRNLNLDEVLQRMMEAAAQQVHGGMTPLEERLAR